MQNHFNPSEPSTAIPRDLGNGLLLRRSTGADAERLSEFNAHIHGEDEQDARAVGAWTRDLFSGKHPTFNSADFTIVEDTRSGKIVSSMNLISQTWSYAGVSFGVGRPELVGTEPEYRRRGLVCLQFDVVHAWSRERGEMLQGITGIPYYYRQFGYEMAVNLGGARTAYLPNVPELKEGQPETHRVRRAQEDDLPFIASLYEHACRRSLLAACWSLEMWRHELLEKSADNVNRMNLAVIETLAGERAGYLAYPYGLWSSTLGLNQYELAQGASWSEISPLVMRFLKETGQELARKAGKELKSLTFRLGEQHPAYEALRGRLPATRKPYAWYVRVPDLPAFLRRITPVLEERLSTSLFSGYSGEVKLGFYRSGVRLGFEQGRLTKVIDGRFEWDAGDASFPGLTFLHLLFGHRSLEELNYIYPDCFCEESKSALLSALFPKQPSDVLAIS